MTDPVAPRRPRKAGTVCPACLDLKSRVHYLCPSCWRALPARARAALYRRDAKAADRLRELYRQIQDDVPLQEIVITP